MVQLSRLFRLVLESAVVDFIGFLGLENVRFRSVVKPGDKLVLVGKSIKINRRQTIFSVQGFVGSTMAFHCEVIGGPLSMNPAS